LQDCRDLLEVGLVHWSGNAIRNGLNTFAILSVVGVFSGVPHWLGFFIVVLSAILFPGIVITRLPWQKEAEGLSFPEKLRI